MKKAIINILTIIAILIVCASVQAQTLKYKSTVTDHFKNGEKATATTKYKSGNLSITGTTLTIDSITYAIVKQEPLQAGDDGYYQKAMVILGTTNKGAYKAYDCVVLLAPDKTIAEVIIKKSKSTNVSYIIK